MRTYVLFFIVGLGLSLVAGCGQKYWYQEGKTFEECKADRAACRAELLKRTDLRHIGDYERQFMEDCMRQKGYRLIPEKERSSFSATLMKTPTMKVRMALALVSRMNAAFQICWVWAASVNMQQVISTSGVSACRSSFTRMEDGVLPWHRDWSTEKVRMKFSFVQDWSTNSNSLNDGLWSASSTSMLSMARRPSPLASPSDLDSNQE